MKDIFETKLGIYFSNKETVLELNGCQIQAYPSNYIDSFRSLTNPKFTLCDEFDFLPPGQQEDSRHLLTTLLFLWETSNSSNHYI